MTNDDTNDIEEQHLRDRGLKYACTDLGNSKRFVDQHGDTIRNLWEERRWIAWDGTRWKPYPSAYKLAEKTVKKIYNEARDCKNTQGQRELSDWAKKSQAKAKLDPMLSLAADALSVSITDFDADPEAINCTNGIVSLKTGKLTEHSSDQFVMKRASADYDPNATCPLWLRFLRDVFSGDEDLIAYMQRALGYSLSGRTNEHCLFIAYGLGANGKTTLFETVLDILGDYGQAADFNLFLNTNKTDARQQEAIGRLRGTRIAIASETESTKSWKEATVKKLTGGDTLIGTKLYGSSYQFQATHKLWFQANHLPGFKDASHGFLRRLVVIPFNARFEGKGADKGLRERLLRERDGIFAWLVRGAQLYFENGLGNAPKACEEATREYRESNDVLGRFINECLQLEYGEAVGVASTYDKYHLWCCREKEIPTPINFFSKGMEERGVTKKATNKGKVFVGYRFADERPRTEPVNDNWRVPAPGMYVYDGPRKETPKPKSIDDIFDEISSDTRKTQINVR